MVKFWLPECAKANSTPVGTMVAKRPEGPHQHLEGIAVEQELLADGAEQQYKDDEQGGSANFVEPPESRRNAPRPG